MPREIPNAIMTALEGASFSPFYAVELQFYNGATSQDATVRFWTGQGNVVLGGYTFIGAGTLLNIGTISEVAELKADGIELQLSGVPEALVAQALSNEWHGRFGKVYFGVSGSTDLVEIFTGLIDELDIADDAQSAIIKLSLENWLVDLQRANAYRYTHESHQRINPGDTFFSYVQDLQDKQIEWGPSD